MRLSRWSLLLSTIISLCLLSGIAAAQVSGAIFTTLEDGTTVNKNIYTDGEDVYLNGGPQNQNAAGLDDGVYFFQVTTPNGALLLSTTPALDRLVKVVNGRFAYRCLLNGTRLFAPPTLPSWSNHPEGTFNAANGSKPVQLWPFNPTTNNGGEYKAWVIKANNGHTTVANDGIHLNFRMRDTKTDNFKIRPEDDPDPGSICGEKFFDSNMNGVRDNGEAPIKDFLIKIVLGNNTPIYRKTDSDGKWSVSNIPGGTEYYVCEVLPADDPAKYASKGLTPSLDWIQTAPAMNSMDERCYDGIVDGKVSGLDFGNIAAAKLCGAKFYDTNGNRVWDADEPTIEGFKIVIKTVGPDAFADTEVLYTDEEGEFCSKLYPQGTSWTVKEVKPNSTWMQTYPTYIYYQGVLTGDPPPYTVAYSLDGRDDLIFGNLVIGQGGGRTRGFWGNKNGFNKMNDGGTVAPELALLNTYNLRNATGAVMNFGSYSAFKSWLGSASATNMAYMLSAQLAAMVLNVEGGYVNPGATIYAPGTLSANAQGFAMLADVMLEAKNSLFLNGYTVASGSTRSYQEKLKNALDKANNNQNFVQAPIVWVPHPY